MGNIWRRIINVLPKTARLQLTFFSSKKMDYEPKRKLICIDGKSYRYPGFNDSQSSQDSESSEEDNESNKVESNITEIQFFPHTEGKYKHSFYVPR